MIIDNDDILILKEFLKLKPKENIPAWSLMRRIYPKGRNREIGRVQSKIRKMANYGLFLINGKSYELITDNVKIRRFKFENKEKTFICIFTYSKWSAFQV